MLNPQQFLSQLHENLNILQERESKYGGNAPLELLHQIKDHRQAIALTEQAIGGSLENTAWQAALQPLLLPFYQDLSQSIVAALNSATTHQLRQTVLAQFKQTARGQMLAEGWQATPQVYQQPLQHELTIILQNDPSLNLTLHRLLAQVEAAGPRSQATLSGSGALAQGPGAAATAATGQGSLAIGAAQGDVTSGSGNVSIRDSRIKAGPGSVIGSSAGGNIQTGDSGLSGESLAALFSLLYRQIDHNPALSPPDREDVTAEVTELAALTQSAAESNSPADESFFRRRLRNIEAMAPDIIDTIATTAANPVAGVKGVWDKIVAKAREIIAARSST